MGNYLSQPVDEELVEPAVEPQRKTRHKKSRRQKTARRRKVEEELPAI